MSSRKAVTFSGNVSPASRRRRSVHVEEGRPRRVEEARDLVVRQARRERDGGEPRRVEDLVRVGVPDPGEERRVRERALQRVVLAPQARDERSERRLERLEAAGVEGEERVAARRRRAPTRASSGSLRCRRTEPASKSRDRRPIFFGMGAGAGRPLQPARHHEVEDEEEFCVPLFPSKENTRRFPSRDTPRSARPSIEPGAARPTSGRTGSRAGPSGASRPLQAALEVLGVDDDVREFRHRYRIGPMPRCRKAETPPDRARPRAPRARRCRPTSSRRACGASATSPSSWRGSSSSSRSSSASSRRARVWPRSPASCPSVRFPSSSSRSACTRSPAARGSTPPSSSTARSSTRCSSGSCSPRSTTRSRTPSASCRRGSPRSPSSSWRSRSSSRPRAGRRSSRRSRPRSWTRSGSSSGSRSATVPPRRGPSRSRCSSRRRSPPSSRSSGRASSTACRRRPGRPRSSGATGSSRRSGTAAWARSGAPSTGCSRATPRSSSSAAATASCPRELVSRFEREAKATAGLRSPHTVQLYDFGRSDDGAFYYVMELLDGFTLDKLVERFGPLAPERVVHVLAAGLPLARRGARGGPRPPRHQAREHLPLPLRRRGGLREGRGLRPREGRLRGRRSEPHADGPHHGDARLHAARDGAREGRGRTRGPLRARLRRLLPPDGPAGLRPQDRPRDASRPRVDAARPAVAARRDARSRPTSRPSSSPASRRTRRTGPRARAFSRRASRSTSSPGRWTSADAERWWDRHSPATGAYRPLPTEPEGRVSTRPRTAPAGA